MPTSLARFAALTLASCLVAPAAGADPAPQAPVRRVVVRNIGLHIGGGPNDAATKAPFKKALEAAFGDFVRCHDEAETAEGTFGVDLLVPANGGRAEVGEPRTAMRGEAFRACVVTAFSAVAFSPPKRGATRLSYSIAFSIED